MSGTQNVIRTCVFLALLIPVAAGLNCSSCSEERPDVRDLANSMAEEFTEMLEFENGTVEDGLPPESDPDGPRLDSFTAPLLAGAEETLEDGTVIGHDYDQWFPVLFRSTDVPANLEHVAGCYVYVQQANKEDQATRHLRVQPYLFREQEGSEHIFGFRAQVHRLAAIRRQLTQALRNLAPRDVPAGMAATDGNAYHVYIALFSIMPDDRERVGNYLIWNLSTYPHEVGDNPVEMCPAHSAFTANVLSDTNLLMLGDCDASVDAAFGNRPSSTSPCDAWNQFASGHNTIMDSIVELAPDPDYQERSTVLYPAGTRFFLHGTINSVPLQAPPGCQLELAWCPGDLSRCVTDTDCPTTHHICCDNLCRDTHISDNFCGSCDMVCTGSDQCIDGICGQVGCQTDDDCPLRTDICCAGTCYDRLTDTNHCGMCDNPCTALQECQNGTCVSVQDCVLDSDCPGSNDICCDNACHDSMSDPDHCGVCDHPCGPTEECSGGVCTQTSQCTVDNDCTPPLDLCCDYTCYNSQEDPNHCGECNHPCAPTEQCSDGICTPLPQCTSDTDCPLITDVCCDYFCYDSLTHPVHCGVCNNPCTADEECVNGGCVPLAECSQHSDCTPPNDICCGGTCFNSLVDRDHCGYCNNPCSADEVCEGGNCILPPQCVQDSDCPLFSDICCGGNCHDSLTSMEHCGVCDNPCLNQDTCQNGMCCPPGGCTEIVLAKWAFDPVLGPPTLVPSEVATHVIAEDFTSNTPPPTILTSPGPIYWVVASDWPNPATNLMAMLSMEPGWRMTITRIEFDQSLMVMAVGMPDRWELSFMGGPGPFASGPIQSEQPEFIHENVDVPPDLHDPLFVEIMWRAQNCNEPGINWGLDNVTVYGRVDPY